MPKISLDNLERYHGHLKDWCDARFAEKKVHENWHEADPSGAVSFYPVPNRPIDPVVNFAFTETLPEGTKGPDNPSTITGVTQAKVTRCGKNICPPKPYTPITYRGVTFEYDPSDGGIFIQGTADADKNPLIDFIAVAYGNNPTPLVRGKTYSFYLACSDSNVSIQLYDKTADTISGNSDESGTQFVHTIKSDSRSILFRLSVARGTAVNTKAYIQIEEGSTATSFEPYTGTDYTVNLGGTYYGGSVDLSTGIMTVTHQRLVYDGTEDIRYGNTYYYFMAYNPQIKNKAAFTTTHFIATATGGIVGMAAFMATSGVRFGWTTEASAAWATEEDLKAWLAAQYAVGTPLTVVYELAEPYTVQLTSQQIYSLSQLDSYTPRINTVYSDQQSVLVRYPKSPIVTGSELDSAILSLGGD